MSGWLSHENVLPHGTQDKKRSRLPLSTFFRLQ